VIWWSVPSRSRYPRESPTFARNATRRSTSSIVTSVVPMSVPFASAASFTVLLACWNDSSSIASIASSPTG
jgi:hypothetical protein